MGYSREIYDAAMVELESRRTRAGAEAAARRETLLRRRPRLREIEQEMAHSALRVTRAVLDGGDVTAAVEAIKNDNLALQAEMAEILAEEGVPYPNLEPQYTCPVCADTGYAGGKICACLRTLLKEESCRRLSRMTAMKLTTFEEMDLAYYPDTPDPATGVTPRKRMEQVLAYCRQYAANFAPGADNLLLRGPTGVGKTHASLAIARQAAEKGHAVIYGPAQVLLHQLEKEHFGRAEGNSEDMLLACDLLVLDDLGAEFASPFYVSCLYNLINTRMLEGRTIILSTNLNQNQLKERYGDQITSRITGTFVPLLFMGRDIRQQKRQEKL